MAQTQNVTAADRARSERRKQWRDRRLTPDRRNIVRLQHTEFDCRRGVPRRTSDLTGEYYDDIDFWWEDQPEIS